CRTPGRAASGRPRWRYLSSGGGRAQMRVEELEQLLFRHVAHEALGLAAVLEEDHRRDRADAEPAGGDRVGVDVELGDAHLGALLVRDLLEDRRDHPARATPGRPEINENGRVGLQDLCLERLVTDNCWLRHVHVLPTFTI